PPPSSTLFPYTTLFRSNVVPVGHMTAFGILFRKELHGTFTSPIAYTVAAVFLLVLGYTFSLTLFATKVANLNYIFHQIYVLSILDRKSTRLNSSHLVIS